MQDFKNLKNVDMKKLANDRATYLNKRIAETFEGCPAYCVCYSLKGDKGLLSYGMVDGKVYGDKGMGESDAYIVYGGRPTLDAFFAGTPAQVKRVLEAMLND